MTYGSVESMVCWLDRKEIAAAKERHYRKAMRHQPRRLRRFVRALKHVLLVERGPEDSHREKIMKRLKIGLRMYQKCLAAVRENLG